MHPSITVHSGAAAMSLAAARRVAAYSRLHPGRLLCLAAGDTPLAALRLLAGMEERGEAGLRAMVYVGLDEWVGLGPGDRGSCRRVMDENFYVPAGIPAGRRRVFDGLAADPAAECKSVAAWMAGHGGIGLAVLGVGLNGHVGFNEPGGPPGEAGDCRVVDLDETTRRVSAKYFGAPRPVLRGMTVGLAALRASDNVVILASGSAKADIIGRAFGRPPSPEVPASLFQNHPSLEIHLDRESAAGLDAG